MGAIQLDDAQLSAVISKAVLDAMSGENRDTLIRTAVTEILTRKVSDRYGARTQMEEAFASACSKVAERIALEEMNKTENLAKVRAVVVAGVDKALGDITVGGGTLASKMVEAIAEKVRQAISGDRY